jgi:hypothetical protein
MAPQPPRKASLLQDAGKPLVLVGPPSHLRGELHIRNSSAEKVIVRQPLMRPVAPTGRGKQVRMALPTHDDAMTLRRIVVRAGQARQIPIALALAPTTPPGTYHAELDVDGDLREVVVHVTEDVSFSLDPGQLVLLNHPGEKVHKQIVVKNTGNVAITVKSIGTVVLDEELVHCRALRGALADVGATMKTLDDFAAALGKRYHDLYENLILKVQNEKTTIDPGDTASIDLTITLPDSLDARTRYTGFAPISTASLVFTIVPD